MKGTTCQIIQSSYRRWFRARSVTGIQDADQELWSIEGTQNTVIRPSSTAGRTASSIPLFSKSQQAPPSLGNQITGRPQCPCTAISADPPREGASNRWYSVRVMAADHSRPSLRGRGSALVARACEGAVRRWSPELARARFGVGRPSLRGRGSALV